MEPKPAAPEEIHAFTKHYIHSSLSQGHPFNLPNEDQDRMACILAAALDAIRKKSRLESRWSPAQLYGTEERLSHFVDTEMEKTGARCRLTIYSGSVSMEFTLPHSNELPSMDSTFWSDLARIIAHHKLTYETQGIQEAVSKSVANESILKFGKSPLFAFLTEFHIAYQNDPEKDIHLGGFGKSIFFLESTWAEIIATLSEIFKDFTRLSQSLYRSYYIKASRDPKRRLSVANIDTVREIFSWILAQSKAWTLADVATTFPRATKIDIQAAHDLAMERDIINGMGMRPFRNFVRTCHKE